MKKLVVTLLAALFVLSIGAVAFADDKTPAAAEPAKESAVKEEKAAAPAAAEPAKAAAPASTEKQPEKAPEAPAAEKK